MLKTYLPLITIGITCYNAADTIARAIESACAQEWSNYEIIVVDDCSTDSSVNVVESIIQNKKSVRLICHQANTGPAGARNTILEHAKGEFLVFFDDDDESVSERLSVQYNKIINFEMDSNHKKVMCFASGIRIYPNGHRIKLPAIGSRDDKTVPHGEAMAARLLFYGGDASFFYGSGTPTCSLMTRTRTLKKRGGFDEGFRRVEDVDMAIRVALAGGYFVGCPEQLFLQYATQASDKDPAKNLEAEQQLAEKYKNYLQSVKRYHYARLWPKLRYHYFMHQSGGMVLTLINLLWHNPIAVPLQLCNTGRKRLMHDYKINKK